VASRDCPPTARAAARGVAILVYDGVTLLDVAGPAEVFKEANRHGARYRIALLSPTGEDVTTNLGFKIGVDAAVASDLPVDTYLVPGSDHYPRTPVPGALAQAARVPAARARRVGSIYTSVGVTAGIDLALALLEEDHGPELTRDVARALVVYMQRSGGQSQFSAPLRTPPPRSPSLRKVVDLVTANPQDNYSMEVLAGHLNDSTRHLTRHFRDELSITPAAYQRGFSSVRRVHAE